MKIVTVTGAGISQSSNIPCFRTETGLWNRYDPNRVCHVDFMYTQESIDFFNTFLELMKTNSPNQIHIWLSSLSNQYECIHFTQNIDTFLEQAGCNNVYHVHGQVDEMRCETCSNQIQSKTREMRCSQCGKMTRPNVVMYGERGRYEFLFNTLFDLTPNDVLIVLGTSCATLKIDTLAHAVDALKILVVNDTSGIDTSGFDRVYKNDIEMVVDKLNIVLKDKCQSHRAEC